MTVPLRRLIRAAVVAGVLSGVPSTAWAVAAGRDPLEATWAAGRMVLPSAPAGWRLLGAAGAAHAVITLGWTAVLSAGLPRHGRIGAGVVAGLGIAAIDLGLAHARPNHPRLRAIADLPIAAQVLDHIAFGALAAACS